MLILIVGGFDERRLPEVWHCAMWDLDEDRLCPGCSDIEPEIDLLTTCGTFNTNDCISYEDMRYLFKVKEKEE